MTVRVAPRPRLFDTSVEAPPPHAGEWRPRWRLPPLFLGVFVVPVLAACVYYFFIATPMYVSEASFVVKAPSQSQTIGLSGILQGVGIGQTQDQTFAVHEYMTSRDAIADLQRRVGFRAMLDRPGSDFWARFPRPGESASSEELYTAYKRYVTVGHDFDDEISTLTRHPVPSGRCADRGVRVARRGRGPGQSSQRAVHARRHRRFRDAGAGRGEAGHPGRTAI